MLILMLIMFLYSIRSMATCGEKAGFFYEQIQEICEENYQNYEWL